MNEWMILWFFYYEWMYDFVLAAEGYTLLVRETPLDPKQLLEWHNEQCNRPRPKEKPQPQQLEVAQCPTGPLRLPPGRRSMVTPGIYNRLTDSL